MPDLDPPRGRPGDWSEPFDLAADREALDAEAARLRISADLLAALAAERELVLRDLDEIGLDRARIHKLLDAASSVEGPALGPGNLFFGYVRDLRVGVARSEGSTKGRPLMLPLRLHESLRRADLKLDIADGEQARGWEIAAAYAGLQMREWALRVALLAR
jgi:hypothetical protein